MTEYAVPLEILHVTDALPGNLPDWGEEARERAIGESRGEWINETKRAMPDTRFHYEKGAYLRFRAPERFSNGDIIVLYYAGHPRNCSPYLTDLGGLAEWLEWMTHGLSEVSADAARVLGCRFGGSSSAGYSCLTTKATLATLPADVARITKATLALAAGAQDKEARVCPHGFKKRTASGQGYSFFCDECRRDYHQNVKKVRTQCSHGVKLQQPGARYAYTCYDCTLARWRENDRRKQAKLRAKR